MRPRPCQSCEVLCVAYVEFGQEQFAEFGRVQPFERSALQRPIEEVQPIYVHVDVHIARGKAEAAPDDAASHPAAEETGGMNSDRNVASQELGGNSGSFGNHSRKRNNEHGFMRAQYARPEQGA